MRLKCLCRPRVLQLHFKIEIENSQFISLKDMKNEELLKAPHSSERCKVSNKYTDYQIFYNFSLYQSTFLSKPE